MYTLAAPPPPAGLPRASAACTLAFLALDIALDRAFRSHIKARGLWPGWWAGNRLGPRHGRPRPPSPPRQAWFARTNPRLTPRALDVATTEAIVKLVGTVHLAIQLPLCLAVIRDAAFAHGFDNPATLYASTPASHAAVAISTGYFLWDVWSLGARVASAKASKTDDAPSPGFLFHGALCATAFMYGTHTGFLSYYGAVFLLWEASTPAVYARWLLATAGLTHSRAYVAAGISMIVTFFGARIAFGLAASARWWAVAARELAAPTPRGVSPAVLWSYNVANVGMCCLNLYWFSRMLAGAAKLASARSSPAVSPAGSPARAAPKGGDRWASPARLWGSPARVMTPRALGRALGAEE